MAAVRNTIKICQENQILSEYIREHEPEVQDNMIACLQDEDYIMKIHILNLEREARAKGLEQGLQQGRTEGLQQGLEQGLQQGRAESDAKYESILKQTESKHESEIKEKDALIAQLKAELSAKDN